MDSLSIQHENRRNPEISMKAPSTWCPQLGFEGSQCASVQRMSVLGMENLRGSDERLSRRARRDRPLKAALVVWCSVPQDGAGKKLALVSIL